MASGTSQKVPLYSLNDLKNTTDDAIAPYLTSLPPPYKFKQSHQYTDVKLAIGYLTVAIAGVLFYADLKLGWDKTKDATAVVCVVYFILNGFLTYWIWKVEAGKVFVGIREGGQKLTLSASVQKHKPIYKLRVQYEAPSGKKWEDKSIEAPFSRWFNEDGYLQLPQLKQWLASNIEPVGLADPNSTSSQYDVDGGETVVLSDNTPMASGSIDTPKSAKSRKGKKKA